PCDQRVLRADEDDRAAAALLDQDTERLPRGEEVAAGGHGVALLPVVERGLCNRRARRETCRRDQDVETPVLEHRTADHLSDVVLPGHVDLAAERRPGGVAG